MERVAILGGGNGAHAAAADLTLRGFAVNLYEDPAFAHTMQVVFGTKQIKTTGVLGEHTVPIATVTSDLDEAIRDVTYILVAVPAFAHKAYAKKLAGAVKPGQVVFLLPGTFGSLILWRAFKEAGVTGVRVAESHTLPYAARLVEPGKVAVMSRFNPLKVGVMPARDTVETVARLSRFFDGLWAVESVVACGLSSLNPIIHVPGCILNAGRIEYAKGEFYFYTEGFTDCVARTTLAVDEERIALLKRFGYGWSIAARGIGSSADTDDLTEAVAGNPSFAAIKGPADTTNRYFSEDIPFGLAIWAQIADHYEVYAPTMHALVHLGGIILGQNCYETGHSMEDLGLAGMDIERLKMYLDTGN